MVNWGFLIAAKLFVKKVNEMPRAKNFGKYSLYGIGGGTLMLFAGNSQFNPYTGRFQFIMFPKIVDRYLADIASEEILNSTQVVHEKHPSNKIVQQLGNYLTKVNESDSSKNSEDYKWKFFTIASPEANACALGM